MEHDSRKNSLQLYRVNARASWSGAPSTWLVYTILSVFRPTQLIRYSPDSQDQFGSACMAFLLSLFIAHSMEHEVVSAGRVAKTAALRDFCTPTIGCKVDWCLTGDFGASFIEQEWL
jgi:hypothetical protein